MNKLCVAALLALSLTGCAQQTFVMKQNQVGAATKTTSQPFFVSGIGQMRRRCAAARKKLVGLKCSRRLLMAY